MNNRPNNFNALKYGAIAGLAGAGGGAFIAFPFSMYGAKIASWAPANRDMDPIVKANNCTWDYGDKYSIDCPKNGTATTSDLLDKAYSLESSYAGAIFMEYAPYTIGITAAICGVGAAVAGTKRGLERVANEADSDMPALVENDNSTTRRIASPSTPLLASEQRGCLSRCFAAMFSAKPEPVIRELAIPDVELGQRSKNTR